MQIDLHTQVYNCIKGAKNIEITHVSVSEMQPWPRGWDIYNAIWNKFPLRPFRVAAVRVSEAFRWGRELEQSWLIAISQQKSEPQEHNGITTKFLIIIIVE